MTGTKQPAQILFLTTEMGGSVSIVNTLRTDTANQTDITIQPTIAHLKQAAVTGLIDQNHFLIGSLNSGIDVPRSDRNFYNSTGMNPHGPIMTTIPMSNR